MAIQKIGFVSDVHVGDTLNSGASYFERSLQRIAVAMTAFNTAQVSLLVEMGDWVDDPSDFDTANPDLIDLQAIWNDNTTYPNMSGIVRLYVVGNHDIATGSSTKAQFMTALAANANDELQSANGVQTRGYYDLGNLRVYILDTCFDSGGGESSAGQSYILPADLTWLDAQLVIADDASKWSVICMHKSINPKDVTSTDDINGALYNIQDLLDVVDGHRVAFGIYGHVHSLRHSYIDPSCVDINGQRILWKNLHPLINSWPAAADADASYSIGYVDDATGEWFFDGNISGGTGLAFEYGTRRLKWTGSVSANISTVGNYDYQKADLTWDTNDEKDADNLIRFSDAYVVSDGTPRTNLKDDSYSSSTIGITEIVVDSDWDTPLGADAGGNTLGLRFDRIGLLEMNGGFAGNTKVSDDYCWINARSGYGKVIVNGANGNGGKYIHISNNSAARADKSFYDVEINVPDNTYTVIFEDTVAEMDMKRLILTGGIVDMIDVRGIDGGDCLGEASVYGGELRLSRDADNIAQSAGIITMYGGVFDFTTGSNAGNGKTVEKFIIYGKCVIKLDVANITVENGFEIHSPVIINLNDYNITSETESVKKGQFN